MGFFVRGVTRRNLFAIVVGAVLAGGPFIAFNLWLDNVIERQGQSEVSTAARRAIALAEARVRDAIGTLDTPAAAGVSSCDQQDMETMRRAAFSTIPVKEIAVIGPDGKTLCNHLGLPPGEREVVSSAAGRRGRLSP
jgi:sensor c-di-GMP phosphodiesterase-like protein